MAGETMLRLRSRMKSVKSARKIARAMFLFAAVKYNRAQQGMTDSRRLKTEAERMLSVLALPNAESKKRCRIVVSGDRGMSGGYNNLIIRSIKEMNPENTLWLPVGRRAEAALKRCDTMRGEVLFSEKSSFYEIRQRMEIISDMLLKGEIGGLEIIFVSLDGDVRTERIIPGVTGEQINQNTIFEPDAAEILKNKLPDLLACIVYADICEAYTCEQKMRRNAMDTAQKNADEMIEDLKKRINRMRQARVTQEIIEATAGCRTENGGG